MNGDGFDEVIVGAATATEADVNWQGWGGFFVLDQDGNEIAFASANGTGLIKFYDWQGTGKPSIMFGGYGDMLLYHYDWVNQTGHGATVKATIPALTAGTSKTIYLAKSATPILPPLGDYTFDFSARTARCRPAGRFTGERGRSWETG